MIYSSVSISQTNQKFTKEIKIGGLLPVGNDLSKVYNFGSRVETGLGMHINSKFTIKSNFNYSFLKNNAEFFFETFNIFSLGLTLNYSKQLTTSSVLFIGPSFVYVYYYDNFKYSDIFRYYNFPNDSYRIFSDHLLTYDIRFGVKFKKIVFEFIFLPINSVPNINNEIVEKIEYENSSYKLYDVNKKKFNLSILSFNIGLTF